MAGKDSSHDTAASGYQSVFCSAQDGLALHACDYGRDIAAEGRFPLVCLPGLTRNARDFHRFALILSGKEPHGTKPIAPRRVIAVDYRGRGLSGRDSNPDNYALPTETADLLTLLSALGVHRAVFAGTSRGALIVHLLAAARPTAIAGAILNDAGPVIEGAGLAQIKSYLTRTPAPKSWDHAASVLRQAHGGTFTALTDRDWAEMAAAIYVEKDGHIVGDFDPALVKQLSNVDFNTPLPTLWPQFDGLAGIPVMVIRGANSALLSKETVAAMGERHPRLTSLTVEGQGHAPIMHTAGVPETVSAFLRDNAL